jgi:hypothetical protein
MFIAALFTIAKLQNQLRYPATDEWIKKMPYICNEVLFNHIKNESEIMSLSGKWIELEIMILCEISETQKAKYQLGMVADACNPSYSRGRTQKSAKSS